MSSTVQLAACAPSACQRQLSRRAGATKARFMAWAAAAQALCGNSCGHPKRRPRPGWLGLSRPQTSRRSTRHCPLTSREMLSVVPFSSSSQLACRSTGARSSVRFLAQLACICGPVRDLCGPVRDRRPQKLCPFRTSKRSGLNVECASIWPAGAAPCEAVMPNSATASRNVCYRTEIETAAHMHAKQTLTSLQNKQTTPAVGPGSRLPNG